MKTILLMGIFLAATTAFAEAQSFTAPARSQQIQRQKTSPPIAPREVTGVVPRAARGGNPLQMLNPRAPARYGTAEQSVAMEPYGPDTTRRTSVSTPNYPGKWRGIKFFSLVF